MKKWAKLIFKKNINSILNHSAVVLGLINENSSYFKKNDLVLIDFTFDGYFIFIFDNKYKPISSLVQSQTNNINAQHVIHNLSNCINKNRHYDILFNNCHSFSNFTIHDNSLFFNVFILFLIILFFIFFSNK